MANVLDIVGSQVPIFETMEINGIYAPVMVNFDDLYSYDKKLGHGGSGVVKCYRENATSNLFAIKEINIYKSTDLEILKGEVDILREINNINSRSIVKYHNSYLRKSGNGILFIIIMECIEGKSLQDYLNEMIVNDEYIDIRTILNIAYWLFDTLALLHYHGYVHRDIKPNNIMVDDINKRFVLIDFGLTCSINNRRINHQIVCNNGEFDGTTIFMAPESFTTNQKRPKKLLRFSGNINKLEKVKLLDIWAAGITIYFLTENRTPWTDKFNPGLINQIIGDYDIPFNRSSEIKDILELALQKDHLERLNAEFIRDYIGYVISNKYYK